MCGLVGVATTGAVDDWPGRIERALDAVEHRGPDARGHLALEGAGAGCVLGHTRLRIIDLRPEADQPIPNEDRSIWVTYNGELYNTPELRRALERSGHVFRSNADTELLVHLYEDVHGDVSALLQQLRGMFAFSLFDATRGRLVVARDRLGIKPMYLADVPNGLAYASEVRALIRAGAVDGDVDEDGFAAYLVWGRVRGPGTLVRGVRELMPGTFVDWRAGRTEMVRWFDPRVEPDPDLAVDAVRLVRAAIDDAVARQLIADRPVGVFLSGGIDSGVVARAAAHSGQVRTLTVTFPDVEDDEGSAAERLAAEIGAEHAEVPVKGVDVAAAMPDILSAMDQPTVDGVNTWLVCRAARDAGLVVALSGLGGDELFGGYPSFRLVPRAARATSLFGAVPAALRPPVVGALSQRRPGGASARLAASRPGFAAAYAAVRQLFAPDELRAFGIRVTDRSGELADSSADAAADRVMLLELENYLPNQLLRDTDQMSMSHSLEVRVPLLDDTLLRVALALPASTRSADGKRLLAVAGGSPATRKRPFALPFDAWLRGPLREPVRDALLTEDRPFAREVPAAFRRHLWRAFEERRTHWSRPWAIAVLRMWPGANGLPW